MADLTRSATVEVAGLYNDNDNDGGRLVGTWPKHSKKELEQLLELFDSCGWRVTKGKKYYKVYCPCGDHQTTVHLSPSNPNYELDKRKWLERQPCYSGRNS